MTYEERERQICRECRENVKCPYIPRKMEYKCQHLSDMMYGWELGYKDAVRDKTYINSTGQNIITYYDRYGNLLDGCPTECKSMLDLLNEEE